MQSVKCSKFVDKVWTNGSDVSVRNFLQFRIHNNYGFVSLTWLFLQCSCDADAIIRDLKFSQHEYLGTTRSTDKIRRWHTSMLLTMARRWVTMSSLSMRMLCGQCWGETFRMDIGELLSYKVCTHELWRGSLKLIVRDVTLFGYDELYDEL
jgi:hypothetical protein